MGVEKYSNMITDDSSKDQYSFFFEYHSEPQLVAYMFVFFVCIINIVYY